MVGEILVEVEDENAFEIVRKACEQALPFSFEFKIGHFIKRKPNDWLHCTFSAIIDIFEMENNREPSGQEVNNIIFMLGDCGEITN